MVHMTPKAWASEDTTMLWLRKIWRRNNYERRLLVWDAFSSHIMPCVKEAVKTEFNTDLAVIPGGCTGKLQPCDVSWNRPFKAAYREKYDEWLINGPRVLTKGGNRSCLP